MKMLCSMGGFMMGVASTLLYQKYSKEIGLLLGKNKSITIN